MKKCIFWMGISAVLMAACQRPAKTAAETETTKEDSSLLPVEDSQVVAVADSAEEIAVDTITYDAGMLTGRWLQPVPGRDNEWQGFDLKKNGKATSINTYSMVYEKWLLQHDTLLLWNHAEGRKSKDSTYTIDTTVIKALTDTSLVLFPVKAAEGYLEQYRKEKAKTRK